MLNNSLIATLYPIGFANHIDTVDGIKLTPQIDTTPLIVVNN